MDDLIDRLRVSAEPVAKLLLEAADALQAAQARIADLTDTLRAVVEIGNSQQSREFADVKKTLSKARTLLSAGSVVLPAPATSVLAARPETTTAESTSIAQPEDKSPDEEVVSGMYKEIQNLLRHSA